MAGDMRIGGTSIGKTRKSRKLWSLQGILVVIHYLVYLYACHIEFNTINYSMSLFRSYLAFITLLLVPCIVFIIKYLQIVP